MFAALSATNEAIMRAKSRAELFELVCQAAAERRQVHLDHHRAGEARQRLSRDRRGRRADRRDARGTFGSRSTPTSPEGRGISGTAFRSRQPCISNDYLTDHACQRLPCRRPQATARSSGAAFPLLAREQAVGVMLFLSTEKDTFTPEFVELLQRLADNVSFALENFDRADEKTQGRRAHRISRLA